MPGIDTYTKLMLHLNNDVIDSETTPKTVSNNNVSFSSSIKKFGDYSAYFNGSAYLSLLNNNDFQFNTGNYTIDCWIKTTDTQFAIYEDGYKNSGTSTTHALYYAGGVLYYVVGPTSATGVVIVQITTNTINDGNFHHVAIVRQGIGANQTAVYIDGIGTTGTSNYNLNTSNLIVIGKLSQYTGFDFTGYIDEFRVSKGIARWTSNFTPPTTEYVGSPTIPTNFSLVPGYTVANFSWTASTDATGYKIKYGTSSGVYDHEIDVGNDTSYQLTGLTDGVTYFAVIYSYSATEQSADSSEVSGTPFLQAPTLNNLTLGSHTLYVSWNTISDATSYKIKYGLVSGIYTQEINVGNTTSYQLTGLINETPYFVVVSTIHNADESLNSNEKSGTPSLTIYNTTNICIGGTATSNVNNSGYEPSRAFDGSTSTNWLDYNLILHNPAWLQYQLPSAKIVYRYRFYCTFSAESPWTWTFQGSNNGSDWIILDTQNVRYAANATWSNWFTFTNTINYLYYRISITSYSNGTEGEINEFEMNDATIYPDIQTSSMLMMFC
jgi:hypothetical protein